MAPCPFPAFPLFIILEKVGFVRKVRDSSRERSKKESLKWGQKSCLVNPSLKSPPTPPLIKGGRGDFRQDRGFKENPGSGARLRPLTNDSLKFMDHVLFEQSQKVEFTKISSFRRKPGLIHFNRALGGTAPRLPPG
jgi:hypothetical protein